MTDSTIQQEVLILLRHIEAGVLELLASDRTTKEWYTTSEAAEILERAEFTVREWCRLGRINAKKRRCGRGDSKEWTISLGEIRRYENEGLLPDPAQYRHIR